MDEYIGIVKIFAGSYAPQGWLMCDGRLLPVAQYQVLFSLISTTYGGDGITNFALPDLRGRAPIGTGQGQGLGPYITGQKGGEEVVKLTAANIPAHVHQVTGNLPVKCNGNSSNADTPDGAYMAPSAAPIYNDGAASGVMAADTVSINLPTSVVGTSAPLSIMNPYIAMNYIICYDGVYPPRP